MTTTLAEKLLTAEELTALADPAERLRTAAETARNAEAQAEPHRLRRNAAALALFATGEVSAVAVWRDIMGISRALWTRLEEVDPRHLDAMRRRLADIEQARTGSKPSRDEADLDRRVKRAEELARIQAELLADGADLTAVAREESTVADNLDQIARAAQEIRNATARGLMNGEFGKPMANAEAAKLTGLTTARMAQLRTSY